MKKCANCGKSLSCGCQRRKASDGRSCCSNCIASYEASIKKINSGPTGLNITYNGPGQQIK
jgi:hypothetical protein